MPIYSYKCTKCGKVFDKLQKPGSNGKIECEFCDGEAIKVFSPVGIIFKGSGFYKTDYGSKSKPASPAKPKTDTSTKNKDSKKESQATKSEASKTGTASS